VPKNEIERGFAISFDEYFAPELTALAEAQTEGLVELSRDAIRVTPLGRLFIRTLAMPFDRYLRDQQMDAKPLFSKTL
jgi:oxygen-independent coproporphyrinogen-3 oxidase